MKGTSFERSLCWWIGLKWCTHSNIPISLSLWILSSTLKQGRFGFSNSLIVGHFLSMFQPTNQTVKSLPNSLSYNMKCRISAWWAHLNIFFSDPTLSFYHHYSTPSIFLSILIHVPEICLYKLETQVVLSICDTQFHGSQFVLQL